MQSFLQCDMVIGHGVHVCGYGVSIWLQFE